MNVPSPAKTAETEAPAPSEGTPSFAEVYTAHFAFVWRSARRLGVQGGSVDDVVQDVFVIVHRRLGDFEGRSSLKTWLFGILLRVVRDHRRSLRRKSPGAQVDADLVADGATSPHECAAKAEAARTLHALLDELSDDKREVFVLADLEQLTAPEIADALGVPLNTVYSRLRGARQDFDAAVARHRARDAWRSR